MIRRWRQARARKQYLAEVRARCVAVLGEKGSPSDRRTGEPVETWYGGPGNWVLFKEHPRR